MHAALAPWPQRWLRRVQAHAHAQEYAQECAASPRGLPRNLVRPSLRLSTFHRWGGARSLFYAKGPVRVRAPERHVHPPAADPRVRARPRLADMLNSNSKLNNFIRILPSAAGSISSVTVLFFPRERFIRKNRRAAPPSLGWGHLEHQKKPSLDYFSRRRLSAGTGLRGRRASMSAARRIAGDCPRAPRASPGCESLLARASRRSKSHEILFLDRYDEKNRHKSHSTASTVPIRLPRPREPPSHFSES